MPFERGKQLAGLVALLVFSGGSLQSCSSEKAATQHGGNPPVVLKEPVEFAQRIFDPTSPPAEMPPLGEGESAQCDSNFTSNASVGGQLFRIGASDGAVTVSQVKMTLGLKVTVWVPNDATQKVIEHEQGHRQISEHYYQTAEQIAAQVAREYAGRRVSVSGADLNAETQKVLQQLGEEITGEYSKRLAVNVAQQRYDELTDHSRNDTPVADAVAQAIAYAAQHPAN
ncbi:MAG TPA: hypothetical protein VMT51_02480 [Dongiaceae bacterium]|nr:hypothetical protein [Dongiaceae bacterium]